MTKLFTHLIALVRLFAHSSEHELARRISFIMIIHGFYCCYVGRLERAKGRLFRFETCCTFTFVTIKVSL